MMYADTDILTAVKAGTLHIKPFVEKNVSGSTLDLTLHDSFLVFHNTSDTHIDVRQPFDVTERVEASPKDASFVVHPGEFLLGSTRESITLPANLAGVLEGRSSLGRLGLIVHATASLVKPGFSGFLTLEITNMSKLPIKLYAGMRIAQLAFLELKSPAKVEYGAENKYQDQDRPAPSRIWQDYIEVEVA